MHFKGFAQHKATMGMNMFQSALDYYAAGNQDPATEFILPAVEYFKRVKKWGDLEAQRVAVIWAMLTVVWNDIDTWIGVMGGKLEFTLKGQFVTGGLQQKDKKRIKLTAEQLLEDARTDPRAMDDDRRRVIETTGELVRDFEPDTGPPIRPHVIRDPYMNDPLYQLE